MPIKLAAGGYTDYVIVKPEKPSPSEERAIKDLAKYLFEITGAFFPVVCECRKAQPHEIVVGFYSRTSKAGFSGKEKDCGKEGFILKTAGETLYIAGGKKRGTMYGVYAFLERYLGCRWFTSEVSRIPKRDTVLLPEIDSFELPAFEYREPFFYEAFDGNWASKNRVNSNAAGLDESYGGKVSYGKYFCHTFNSIISPEEYFDTHPEYFSEVDGVRVRDRSQLCLTNPEVLQIAVEKVKSWIREFPEATIFSVTQNDWGNYCQCEKCREIEDGEGGAHSAPMLWFANQVAEQVCAEYPDKLIDTFAYFYTYKAPLKMRAHPNVIVRLCDIECCFLHPHTDCCPQNPYLSDSSKSFYNEIQKWSRLCDRLYIWDYCTNFLHFLMPRPDLPVIVANLRFFHENNVKGLFEQGSYVTPCGYFAELKSYLFSKLMWEPYADENVIADEFMQAVYGPAAYTMKTIADEFRSDLLKDGTHLYFSTHAQYMYRTLDLVNLEKYRALYEEAERLAADGQTLAQVKKAKLWLRYLEIYKMPLNFPCRNLIIDDFVKDSKAAGVLKFEEIYSLERSVEWMRESLDPDRRDYNDPDNGALEP